MLGHKVGKAEVAPGLGRSLVHEGQGILEFVTSLWTMLSWDTPAYKGCFVSLSQSRTLGWSRLHLPG